MKKKLEKTFRTWWFKTTGLYTEYPETPMEIAEISFKAGWDAAHATIKKTREN